MIILLQILASLKVFDQIFLLTAGGPDGATRSIIQYIYDTGFSGYRVGYASAVSYIFFAIIVLISLFQMAVVSRGRQEHKGALLQKSYLSLEVGSSKKDVLAVMKERRITRRLAL